MTALTTEVNDWPICAGLYLVVGVMIYLLMWAAMPQEGKDDIIGSFKRSQLWQAIVAVTILIIIWLPFLLWYFVIKGVLVATFNKIFK